MNRLLSLLFTLSLAFFGFCGTAMALSVEDLPVNTSEILSPEKFPEGENLVIQKNDSDLTQSLLTITDKRNDNRIEIFARVVQKDSYADKLFDVFYDQLDKKKNLAIDGERKKFKYVEEVEGWRAKYNFDAGVSLTILTYAFSVPTEDSQTAAILVVGYYPKASVLDGETLFEEVIMSMLKNMN